MKRTTTSIPKRFSAILCLALWAGMPRAQAQGSLVQNGNFQQGFADWTGLQDYIINATGLPGGGNCGQSGDIWQVIPTVAGDDYLTTFTASTRGDILPNTYYVAINGTRIASFSALETGGWGTYSCAFVASSATTEVEFNAKFFS